MPLSDSQVKALKAGPRKQNVSVGDSLLLVIESETRGGGKSFEGRLRFPPGRKGKQVPVRIGVYGKGVGKWSLREAREEWDRIRTWSRQTGRDPRELKKENRCRFSSPQVRPLQKRVSPISAAKTKSLKEYPNLLNNQIIPRLGADTREHLLDSGIWRKEGQREGDGDFPFQGR